MKGRLAGEQQAGRQASGTWITGFVRADLEVLRGPVLQPPHSTHIQHRRSKFCRISSSACAGR